MKHILMVCYGGGHMKVLAPLYSELVRRYRVTILALTSAGPYMREQGIPSLGFSDFAFTRSADIQAYGHQLATDIPENGPVSREETVAYLGASFCDLVYQLGSEQAAFERYREKGRAAFLPVKSLRRMIKELKVDAVVTTNAPRAERAALIAAKAEGVPTVCINDNLWIRNGLNEIAERGLADRICVLTSGVRKRLLEETGIDGKNVIVTGTPVFDQVKERKRVCGGGNKPRVLLADQVLPTTHPFLDITSERSGVDEGVRRELDLLASRGDIEAYLRPHPNQIYNYEAFRSCSVSSSRESLHERLSKTDVVVTAISTVGIEGKAMGLGLVSIEDTVFSTRESYERCELSTGIREPSELGPAIFEEFSKVRSAYHEALYEGVASKNIISVLEELIG